MSARRSAVCSLAVALVLTAVPAGAEDGKPVYEATCVNCHGADGRADTKKGKALKAPSLLKEEKLRASPPEVAAFVQKSVRGKKKHKQTSAKVSDEQLAAVAEYIRVLVTAGGQ
jgi:mono/diheme cytochrome c family protein